MTFCVRCGVQRRGSEQFCLSCGWQFTASTDSTDSTDSTSTDSSLDVEAPAAGPPEPTEHPGALWANPARPQPRRRRPAPWALAWITAVVLVAAGTVGVVVYVSSSHHHTDRLPPDVQSLPSQDEPEATADPTDTDTADPTDTAEQTDPPEPVPTPTDPYGVVTLADPVATNPDAAAVMSLVSQYFLAINTRDYQLYYQLHTTDTQIALDPDTFERGYQSTRDSAALITTIGVQVDGDPFVEVTFTSYQNPVDSPTGDGCNHWHITLFLLRSGDLLQIGAPPDGYHAQFEPC